MAADVPNSVFSAFSFIGFILVLVPFYWHREAWNTGTCLYMGWTAVQLLNFFINSVVWNNNAINWAPIWCDISIRIFIGSSVAILAASLCINRRLYHISKVQAVIVTKQEKQRTVLVDLIIGLGIPILQMILSYIVQGHRFDIYEDIGCYPFIYNTWVAYPLSKVWPLAISMVSAVYSILSIREFAKRKAEFSQFISVHNNLTTSRYLRLIALAGVEVLCGIPLSIYSIWLNVTYTPVYSWTGWADVHFDFSRVQQVPALIWRLDPTLQASLESSRWFAVICAFVFFAFFGFADEAIRHYKLVYIFIAKRLGLNPAFPGSKASGSSVFVGSKPRPPPINTSMRGPASVTLPIYLTRSRQPRRGSDLSFSDKLDSVIFIGPDLDSRKEGPAPHPSEALELEWPDIHVSSPQYDLDVPRSVKPSPYLGAKEIV
ncbi:pheromone receptor Rcb3 B43 [Neolentinus lepideus HHB14362 ss-1]|uniref:Pheromone receptor Rcb3 B43 n=1 Tax=Neolentinus lepideus HHB14362 ss-1 TaxID=1314782 RepID=A0A165UYT8_9AGAM|nr:pheromone receptor Rcb3 B43 [Neolentinus lepideus HHB14362 ss-1]